MNSRTAVQLILTLFLIGTVTGSVYGAQFSHKSLTEIYNDIPLGEVENDIKQMLPQTLEDETKLNIGHMSKCYTPKSAP